MNSKSKNNLTLVCLIRTNSLISSNTSKTAIHLMKLGKASQFFLVFETNGNRTCLQ